MTQTAFVEQINLSETAPEDEENIEEEVEGEGAVKPKPTEMPNG